MIIGTAISKSGTTIRLTEERWLHIVYSHREIDLSDFSKTLDLIENPDFILKGEREELLAVKKRAGRKEWFVVIYKEINKIDGFVIIAYLTSDLRWLLKREVVWNKKL